MLRTVKSEQARMKSSAYAADEIKSALQPDEVGFLRETISSTAGGFLPRKRI